MTIPLDFMNNEIKVGSLIVYPTGGTSARMVLAKVIDIKTPDGGTYNGLKRGKYRLVVNRIREGDKFMKDQKSYDEYKYNPVTRKHNVDNLHRVVVVGFDG